jgi:DEAD/DEAH box helicase domain-containing protein
MLEEEGIVRHTGGRWHYSDQRYPSEGVSLRSPTVENFVILNTAEGNRLLGEVDYDSAPFLIHEDAIYMHQSQTFFIQRLDWDGRTAYAEPVNVDYYTDALAKTDIAVLAVDLTTRFDELERVNRDPAAWADFPLASRNYGDVNVTTLVAKFKKIRFATHENVGYGDVHTPPNEMQTESYWLSFREDLKEWCEARGLDASGGLRALATMLNNLIPVFMMCDPRDIRCWPMMRSPFDQRPVIHVYDAYPGGVGLSKKLFAMDRKVLTAARELVVCRCAAGCPSCVGPALEVGPRGKRTAAVLLDRILTVLDPRTR